MMITSYCLDMAALVTSGESMAALMDGAESRQ
jgi:hypothetical protein